MNTATWPRPVSLTPPWPLRWARAAVRWFLAPRRAPHVVRVDLSLHGLHDIGAPIEWHRDARSAAEIERASLRMQGLHRW